MAQMGENKIIAHKKSEFLIKEMKDFIVSVGWTHKIQISQSELHEKSANKMRIVKILSVSLTSAGLASLILQVLPDYHNLSLLITFTLSLSTIFIESFEKDKDFNKLSENSRAMAGQFWELRVDCESLLYKLKAGEDIGSIQNDFQKIKDLRKTLVRDLPNATSKAVAIASEKLKKHKDNNYTNDYELFNLED